MAQNYPFYTRLCKFISGLEGEIVWGVKVQYKHHITKPVSVTGAHSLRGHTHWIHSTPVNQTATPIKVFVYLGAHSHRAKAKKFFDVCHLFFDLIAWFFCMSFAFASTLRE